MAPKSTKVCSVAMCTKPIRRAGPWCYAHYMKKWRYGTPTPKHQEFREDLTGKRFDELLVIGYAGGGYWDCKCECGQEVRRRAGDLNRTYTRNLRSTCGNWTVHRRQEWVDYTGAHCRVRTEKGSASDHLCIDCGERANHWSYDHADPDEQIAIGGTARGCAYSLKAEHYRPMCTRCHKAFDIAHLKKIRGEKWLRRKPAASL